MTLYVIFCFLLECSAQGGMGMVPEGSVSTDAGQLQCLYLAELHCSCESRLHWSCESWLRCSQELGAHCSSWGYIPGLHYPRMLVVGLHCPNMAGLGTELHCSESVKLQCSDIAELDCSDNVGGPIRKLGHVIILARMGTPRVIIMAFIIYSRIPRPLAIFPIALNFIPF